VSCTVVLADDHAVVREGLRLLLEAQEDIRVVGQAGTGREVVAEAGRLGPHVVVMDISMPDLSGIEATRLVKHRYPEIAVVILSMHVSTEHVFQALSAGAIGYVLKESAGDDLVAAVRAAAGGRRFLSDRINASVLDDYVARRQGVNGESSLGRLSARERQVLQAVVEGRTSAAIAAELHLSPKTVETYRSRLMAKLGVRDLPALVKLAIQHGLTSLE